MTNIDNLLTIILVIRDRPYYTFRWMDYANKTHFPFKILIADGGRDLEVETRLQDHSNFPDVNYDYLRYPYDARIKDYLYKISDALNQVTTPYVILADDDDFWSVDGIRASTQFLEMHAEYATCRGRNFSFAQDIKNPMKTVYLPSEISDITDEVASDRMMKIYPQLSGTFYDVHRTAQFQIIFKKVAGLDFHLMPMIEIMVLLLDAANGKIKRLDCSYLIREDGHGQSTSRSGSYLERILTGPCAAQLSAMCDAVAESVASKENKETKDFAAQLHRLFIEYIAPSVSNHIYAYHDISLSRVIQDLKTWVIYRLERKYQYIGKKARAFTQYLTKQKTKKAYRQYLKKCHDQEMIFTKINQFLSEKAAPNIRLD